MENKMKLSPNSLAFIAMTNEYCHELENILDYDKDSFVARMLKLLPRIYISANDIELDISFSDYYIDSYLEEEAYNQVRNYVSQVMAEDDVYLDTFVDDMKYSDTPVATSVSENLADLYQEVFNFIASVKNAPTEVQQELLGLCKDNFKNYWSQTICNAIKALNKIYYNPDNI